MQESSKFVPENWKRLQLLFFEPGGLLSQIEQGLAIKQEDVQEVKVAFATLRDAWEKQDTVPRQQVFLLWNAFLRLEQILTNKEQDNQETLFALIGQIRKWLEEVFEDKKNSIGEDRAIEVLLQHLIGGPSFGLQLRQGYVNASFFHDFVLQIEKLKGLWEGQEEVSISACRALFAIEQLSWSSKVVLPDTMQQEIARMKQDLYEQVSACLHGNMIGGKEE